MAIANNPQHPRDETGDKVFHTLLNNSEENGLSPQERFIPTNVISSQGISFVDDSNLDPVKEPAYLIREESDDIHEKQSSTDMIFESNIEVIETSSKKQPILVDETVYSMRHAKRNAVSEPAIFTGIHIPPAANEVTFDVLNPPLQPVTSPSIEPVVSELSKIKSNDVLLGRGGGTNGQIGNFRYRNLIRSFKPLYLLCRRKDKPLIARSVVLIIRNRGGRFLIRDERSAEAKAFYEVGDEKAEAKTAQALREGLAVRSNTTTKVFYNHDRNANSTRRKVKTPNTADNLYDIDQFGTSLHETNGAFAPESVMNNPFDIGIMYNVDTEAHSAPIQSALAHQAANIINRNGLNPQFEYNFQGNNLLSNRRLGILPDAAMLGQLNHDPIIRGQLNYGNAHHLLGTCGLTQPDIQTIVQPSFLPTGIDFDQAKLRRNAQPSIATPLICTDRNYPQAQIRGGTRPMARIFHQPQMRAMSLPRNTQFMRGSDINQPQMKPIDEHSINRLICGDINFRRGQINGNIQPLAGQLLRRDFDAPTPQTKLFLTEIDNQMTNHNQMADRQVIGNDYSNRSHISHERAYPDIVVNRRTNNGFIQDSLDYDPRHFLQGHGNISSGSAYPNSYNNSLPIDRQPFLPNGIQGSSVYQSYDEILPKPSNGLIHNVVQPLSLSNTQYQASSIRGRSETLTRYN